jgi:hypothetical protein
MKNLNPPSINLSTVPGFKELLHENPYSSNNIFKLNRVACKTNENKRYSIIKYDKDVLPYELATSYGLCRSVIVNDDNKVISYSPPKSIQFDLFRQKYSDNKYDNLVAEEFVEGTMINIFWDPTVGLSGSWEIATRNNVGANSSFFLSNPTKTFRDMFLEAAKENNLNLDKLSKVYNFSFVLQHPDNRIVVPIKKPQLYLVSAYSIHHDSDECIEIVNHRLSVIKEFQWTNTTIQFPKVYPFKEYVELLDKYGSMNTPYEIMGVVIKNEDTFERTKIRNPVYEEVKLLRGNQPKLQYQYISLRKQGKVKNYLKYYKEHKDNFNEFKKQIHNFTSTLLTNYISCYVKKEKPLTEFPQQYKTHMFNLHQTYIKELREKKLYINKSFVVNYVNNLDPSLLMYSLNFNHRKLAIDTIKNDGIKNTTFVC